MTLPFNSFYVSLLPSVMSNERQPSICVTERTITPVLDKGPLGWGETQAYWQRRLGPVCVDNACL